MNHHSLQSNDALREQLAAEYVLGTLRGGARRRFESWLHTDATLMHAVMRWQANLNPLAEFAPPVEAPPGTWSAIERELGLRTRRAAPRATLWSRLRDDLQFWRGLGIAATAMAMLLAVALVIRAPQNGAPAVSYIATLSADNAQPAVIVTGNAARRTLTVKVIAQQKLDADKSLELWALPAAGAPQSLGLIAPNGSVTLHLPEDITPQSAPILAISLEPKGGSPNPRAPSGPVLYKGAWVQV